MNTNKPLRPYGRAYQTRAAKAAIAAGCKGTAMGVLYCIFTKVDFDTGETPALAHTSLAEDMGGLNYKTIQTAVTALKKAGILAYADYKGRGVKWSDQSGHANRYKLALPVSDPTQKTGSPLPKKRADPYPKNGKHYKNPSFSDGEKDTASRRGGDKVDVERAEELRVFGQMVTKHGYTEGKAKFDAWKAGKTLAAE